MSLSEIRYSVGLRTSRDGDPVAGGIRSGTLPQPE
jgi:hypothetical protein